MQRSSPELGLAAEVCEERRRLPLVIFLPPELEIAAGDREKSQERIRSASRV